MAQHPAVRVPIYCVIPLALGAIAWPWWHGTRGMDFLRPPDESELAAIRARAEAAFPRSDQSEDAVSVPAELGLAGLRVADADKPPLLGEYLELAADGSEGLVDLAKRLERGGQTQRALLAWERVVECAPATSSCLSEARDAVLRLRPSLPPWHSDPSKALPIRLSVGTGPSMAGEIAPLVLSLADELTAMSGGILRIAPELHAGRSDFAGEGAVPIAMWFSGMEEESPSTDVLSFTSEGGENLEMDLRHNACQLIEAHFQDLPIPLARLTTAPPNAWPELRWRASRLAWETFGRSLSPAAD
jgi:hypothetical protein